MNRRRIEALRNLAERPGTDAEGQLARELLERAKQNHQTPEALYEKFRDYLRTGSMDDLADACECVCDCGATRKAFVDGCDDFKRHEQLLAEKLRRFPRGTRVYYNRWAYSENCPGVVTGPSRYWSWIRIKFDHLTTARAVPIYSPQGWHLSTEPLDRETLRRSGLRGGMQNIDGTNERIA